MADLQFCHRLKLKPPDKSASREMIEYLESDELAEKLELLKSEDE